MTDSFPSTTQFLALFARFRDGETAAREELFSHVTHRLQRLARRMLRDFPQVARMEDTDDVLQKALIRLLAALKEVEPTSSRAFLGLSAEMVQRELLDLARYYGRDRRKPGLATQQEISTAILEVERAPQPSEDPDDLERWAMFHEQVRLLPEEEREVVHLRFYHGWTYEEIGALIEMDKKRVSRLWHRALFKLKEYFRKVNDD